MSVPRALRTLVFSLAAVLALLVGSPALAAVAPVEAPVTQSTVKQTTVKQTTVKQGQAGKRHGCSAEWYQDDRRLGPEVLSNQGETGVELVGYRRTGKLSSTAFLAKYWDPTLYDGAGGWIYPPQNGYRLDRNGDPIMWTTTLGVGRRIDRYGSEYGSFLAPRLAPYARRSIPPSNLVGSPAELCNHYLYRVLKPLPVRAGLIAAWFEQPGGGIQYQLDGTLIPGAPVSINVMWLLDQGYLERV